MKNLIIITCLLLLVSGCATFGGQQSLADNQGSLAESQVAIAEYLHLIRNDILLLQLIIINMDKYQPTGFVQDDKIVTWTKKEGK